MVSDESGPAVSSSMCVCVQLSVWDFQYNPLGSFCYGFDIQRSPLQRIAFLHEETYCALVFWWNDKNYLKKKKTFLNIKNQMNSTGVKL